MPGIASGETLGTVKVGAVSVEDRPDGAGDDGIEELDDRDDDLFDAGDEIQQIKETQRKATPNQTTSGGNN